MFTQDGSTFWPNATYVADLTGHMSFGGMPEHMLHDLYRYNGRALAWPIYKLIAWHFVNLVPRSQHSNAQQVLMDTRTKQRWRLKMFTHTKTCDFSKSGMLGEDRHHKPDKYLEHWARDIEGWIVVDSRKMPSMVIAAVRKHMVIPPFHVMDLTRWQQIASNNPIKRRTT